MDDVAAAVVDRALLGPAAAAPDQEGVDGVDAASIQSGTNSSHALKLIRPSTAPSIRIGVIAAKTNWK